jgi:hypothetical protein
MVLEYSLVVVDSSSVGVQVVGIVVEEVGKVQDVAPVDYIQAAGKGSGSPQDTQLMFEHLVLDFEATAVVVAYIGHEQD